MNKFCIKGIRDYTIIWYMQTKRSHKEIILIKVNEIEAHKSIDSLSVD